MKAVLLAWLLLTAPVATRPVSLDVRNADVRDVFRLLARVGEVNIVVSDRVSGRVTVSLHQVPWGAAFEAVLEARGLGVTRSGNVLQIDTLEALRQAAEAKAAILEAQQAVTALQTLVLPLSYADAAEMKTIVQGMLSPRGTIQVDTRTNALIITDVPAAVGRISGLGGP